MIHHAITWPQLLQWRTRHYIFCKFRLSASFIYRLKRHWTKLLSFYLFLDKMYEKMFTEVISVSPMYLTVSTLLGWLLDGACKNVRQSDQSAVIDNQSSDVNDVFWVDAGANTTNILMIQNVNTCDDHLISCYVRHAAFFLSTRFCTKILPLVSANPGCSAWSKEMVYQKMTP